MKIVVVEDQSLFREFLEQLVSERHELVGSAVDGEGALELINRVRPDLVILDLLIPKLSGIEVAKELMATHPQVRILALSAELDNRTLYAVGQLGIDGIVDKKDAGMDVLRMAIQEIGAGRIFSSPGVRERLTALRQDRDAFHKILSLREQEILTHIGAGLTDSAIAGQLGISKSSAQTHRRNICRKLDLHSTPELMRYALDHGFWKSAFPEMEW